MADLRLTRIILDASKLTQQINVRVAIKGHRLMTWRIGVALALMRLAVRVGGFGSFEIQNGKTWDISGS